MLSFQENSGVFVKQFGNCLWVIVSCILCIPAANSLFDVDANSGVFENKVNERQNHTLVSVYGDLPVIGFSCWSNPSNATVSIEQATVEMPNQFCRNGRLFAPIWLGSVHSEFGELRHKRVRTKSNGAVEVRLAVASRSIVVGRLSVRSHDLGNHLQMPSAPTLKIELKLPLVAIPIGSKESENVSLCLGVDDIKEVAVDCVGSCPVVASQVDATLDKDVANGYPCDSESFADAAVELTGVVGCNDFFTHRVIENTLAILRHGFLWPQCSIVSDKYFLDGVWSRMILQGKRIAAIAIKILAANVALLFVGEKSLLLAHGVPFGLLKTVQVTVIVLASATEAMAY